MNTKSEEKDKVRRALVFAFALGGIYQAQIDEKDKAGAVNTHGALDRLITETLLEMEPQS